MRSQVQIHAILMHALLICALLSNCAVAQTTSREVQAEFKKLQGLWQYFAGGMEHQDGQQVVRQPDVEGEHFFIYTDRLIWLDQDGKPTGREDKIAFDVTVKPKRITLTQVNGDKETEPSHGIYELTDSGLRVHFGLEGGPAPRQFLELNKPVEGVDGEEWIVSRKKLREE